MKSARSANRWLDGMIVGLVVTLLGFAATAPRAAREATSRTVTVVEAPASACSAVAAPNRAACLNAARATLLRR